MPVTRPSGLTLFAMCFGTLFGFPQIGLTGAEAADLVGHRAVYNMKLHLTRTGNDLSDIQGKMAMEWSDVCDGWALNQKMVLAVKPVESEGFKNSFSFSSYEAKDGLLFRFTMRTLTNDIVTEDIRGRAELESRGGAGEVVFDLPEDQTLDLPPGTIFPSDHLHQSAAHAASGKRALERLLFTGTDVDGLEMVSGFLGPSIPPGTRDIIESDSRDDTTGRIAELKGKQSWMVAFGYFPVHENSEQPEFEIQYRLMENGVAPFLDLDYGDYVIRAVLDYLEYLPEPSC